MYPLLMVWIILSMTAMPMIALGAVFSIIAVIEGENPTGGVILFVLGAGVFAIGSTIAGNMMEKEFGEKKNEG